MRLFGCASQTRGGARSRSAPSKLIALSPKRATTNRPLGKWSDDDYDVLWDGAIVGRMKAAAAPVGTSTPVTRRRECRDHGTKSYLRDSGIELASMS